MDSKLEDMKKAFFEYIEKRQSIWYKRNVEKLPYPWSDDEILNHYKFCNAFRELDAGTKAVIDNVVKNDSLDLVDKLFNIIIYRWCNVRYLYDYIKPCKIKDWDFDHVFNRLQAIKNDGKIIFNPAYMVTCNHYTVDENKYGNYLSQPCGVKICRLLLHLGDSIPKLENICEVMTSAKNGNTAMNALQDNIRFIGDFISLQIVLDMGYTRKLAITENDIDFVGDGALKGVNYIRGKDKNYGIHLMSNKYDARRLMRSLWGEQNKYLKKSFRDIVPIDEIACVKDGRLLSLQNIEFNLCEFRKYHSYMVNENKHSRKYVPCEI